MQSFDSTDAHEKVAVFRNTKMKEVPMDLLHPSRGVHYCMAIECCLGLPSHSPYRKNGPFEGFHVSCLLRKLLSSISEDTLEIGFVFCRLFCWNPLDFISESPNLNDIRFCSFCSLSKKIFRNRCLSVKKLFPKIFFGNNAPRKMYMFNRMTKTTKQRQPDKQELTKLERVHAKVTNKPKTRKQEQQKIKGNENNSSKKKKSTTTAN